MILWLPQQWQQCQDILFLEDMVDEDTNIVLIVVLYFTTHNCDPCIKFSRDSTKLDSEHLEDTHLTPVLIEFTNWNTTI